MKSLTRLAVFALLLAGRPGFAQNLPLPNGGFETWQARTYPSITGPRTVQIPQSWEPGLFTSVLLFFGQPLRFDRSTTHKHSGASSAHFTMDSIGSDLQIRFPLTRSYLGVQGWSRTSVVSPDSAQGAFMLVFLTHSRATGGEDTVAVGGMSIYNSQPATWQRFNGPIILLRPEVPDSATVDLGISEGSFGEELWLDDVEFTVNSPLAAPADQPAPEPLTLAPNPAQAGTDLSLTVAARQGGRAALILTDVLGRTAGWVRVHELTPGDNHLAVPTRGLPPGTYLVRVLSADGEQQTRVVIQ